MRGVRNKQTAGQAQSQLRKRARKQARQAELEAEANQLGMSMGEYFRHLGDERKRIAQEASERGIQLPRARTLPWWA